MTAPDLTNLTADELRRIAIGDGTTADDPYAAVDELHRRAQANALVQAERDEFDEELHTCRAIVGATSEHLHVDLEELVDKLRRTEADSRSWQELATARAQANDALRSAAERVASAKSCWVDMLGRHGEFDVPAQDMAALRAALAAAPAAQPTPAAPVTDAEIEAAIEEHADTWFEYGSAMYETRQPGAASIGTLKGEAHNSRDALRSLIARRVASAGAAPVDSEREAKIGAWCAEAVALPAMEPGRKPYEGGCAGYWLTASKINEAVRLMRSAPPAPAGDQDAKLRELREWVRSTWKKNAATGKGGWWSNDAKEIAAEIDRLLAAPAASAIAAALEAPAWQKKLDAAAAELGDEHSYALSIALSDVDHDLRTVRDFVTALREQVESHARRIEALERAAQDGGQ